MKECSKAVMRRLSDPNFLNRYFVGDGLDVGAGPDPLHMYREFFPRMRSVAAWDLPQGDAQLLAGVADQSLDFVHSSHCLEHMVDPAAALANWFRVLRPGGFLVVTVPDEDLYEQGDFPSRKNADHKWTFTISKQGSWSPRSVNIVDLVRSLGPAGEVHRMVLLDWTHRYSLPKFDQTLTPIGEAAIELVVRKRTAEELAAGGRLPPAGRISPEAIHLLTGLKPQGA